MTERRYRRPRPVQRVRKVRRGPTGPRGPMGPAQRQLAAGLFSLLGVACVFALVVARPLLSELRYVLSGFGGPRAEVAQPSEDDPSPDLGRDNPSAGVSRRGQSLEELAGTIAGIERRRYSTSEPTPSARRVTAVSSTRFPLGLWMFPASEQGAMSAPSSERTRVVETTAPLVEASEGLFARQSMLAAQPAVKVFVRREGWYRIEARRLLEAGLDPQTDPRRLALFADARQLAMAVVGEQDGRIDPQDSLEFYGVGIDAPTGDTRTYWLGAGREMGRRISKTSHPASGSAARSFPLTVERADRDIYFSALRNGDIENFFGPMVAGKPVDLVLHLHHVDFGSRGPTASLEVSLQGANQAPHRIMIEFNGQTLGTLAFEDQTRGSSSLALPATRLREGENRVRLTPLGGETDVNLLDRIRLTYLHTYTADDGMLRFTSLGRRQFRVEGFTQPGIRVIDVTTPETVIELAGKIEQAPHGYTITATPSGEGMRHLLAFTGDAVKSPAGMRLNRPSEMRRSQPGADLLILTRHRFFPVLQPVASLRREQGLSVRMVDVEDIFDEFSFGHPNPQAIKSFLHFASLQWSPKPRFVLLGGDASLDGKNRLGQSAEADLVPTKLIDTRIMETSSDDWLADFDGDGLAEIALGRLPFNDSDEARRMVEKLLRYDTSEPANEVVLVADDSYSGYSFVEGTDRLKPLLAPALKVHQIRRTENDGGAGRGRLLEALGRGAKIINYMGHGSVDLWRGNLLTSSEARTLKRTSSFPLFVMMTCLNGYFQDPAIDSVAEALMKAEGGAAAVWTSSGQTEPEEQLVMNQAFYRSLFSGTRQRPRLLGEVILEAKASIQDTDIRYTWILFGDPSMPVR